MTAEDIAHSGDPVKIEVLNPPPSLLRSLESPSKVFDALRASGSPAPLPTKNSRPLKLLCLDGSSVQITHFEDSSDGGSDSSPELISRSRSLPTARNPRSAFDRDTWQADKGDAAEADDMESPQDYLDAAAQVPSSGSFLHGTGECTPCVWFWRPSSCQNAEQCGYCHLCPQGETKSRKKNKVSLIRLGISTPKAKTTLMLTSLLGS